MATAAVARLVRWAVWSCGAQWEGGRSPFAGSLYPSCSFLLCSKTTFSPREGMVGGAVSSPAGVGAGSSWEWRERLWVENGVGLLWVLATGQQAPGGSTEGRRDARAGGEHSTEERRGPEDCVFSLGHATMGDTHCFPPDHTKPC